MKNKIISVVSLLLMLLAAVALGICIFSDINDQLFLPLALVSIVVGNALQLISNKKKGEN